MTERQKSEDSKDQENARSCSDKIRSCEIEIQKKQRRLNTFDSLFRFFAILGVILFLFFLTLEWSLSGNIDLIQIVKDVVVLFSLPVIFYITKSIITKQLASTCSLLENVKKEIDEQVNTLVEKENCSLTNTDTNPNNYISSSINEPAYKPLSQVIDELLYYTECGGVYACHINSLAFNTSEYAKAKWDISKWHYDNFDYVNSTDGLLTISCSSIYSRCSCFPDQIVKAPVSGFLCIKEKKTYDRWYTQGDVVCEFYNSINLLIDKLSLNQFEVEKDDFSSDIVVRGKRIVGSLNWYTLGIINKKEVGRYVSYEKKIGHIQINFENRMGEYSLLLKFTRKAINVRKNDILQLLFVDGSTISLNSLSSPVKSTDAQEDSVIRYALKSDHIKMFRELFLSKWQIKSSDGEVLGTGDIHHRDKGIGLVFRDFIVKFENEVRRNISETDLQKYEQVEDLGKQGDSSESCYVYLMKDLSNNYYKIGISNRPEYREKTLQSEKPTIELLCSKKYPSRKMAKALESALHKTYSEQHVRGEWFELEEDDVSEIMSMLS